MTAHFENNDGYASVMLLLYFLKSQDPTLHSDDHRLSYRWAMYVFSKSVIRGKNSTNYISIAELWLTHDHLSSNLVQ